jgi:translation initiation factor IF-3
LKNHEGCNPAPALSGGANISFEELRVNQKIRADKVRLIDAAGVSLGILSVPEAVKIAEEKGFDLVEISPNAVPPVCKLLDYGKYRYAQMKKDKSAKKKQHVVVVKELMIRPVIDKHDLGIKMNHAMEFLDKGFKIKFSIKFRGRELEYKQKGYDLFGEVVKTLAEKGELETGPISEDRSILFTVNPRKK